MKKDWILAVAVACCIILLSIRVSGISTHEEAQIGVYGASTLLALKKVVPHCVVLPRTIEDSISSLLDGNRDELDAACVAIQNNLRNKMRASLHKVGLEVLQNSNLADEQTAYLQVQVVVRKIAKDPSIYAFSVHIQLTQLVQLVRNPKIRTTTETWPEDIEPPDIMFVSGFHTLQKTIEKEVTIKLDIFINDYLAANPKEQPTKGDVKNRDIFDQVEESTKP